MRPRGGRIEWVGCGSFRQRAGICWSWVHIARDDPKAADRVLDRIEAACKHLRDHPKLGPARPQIGDGARVLIIERWLALYKVEPGGIQIVRVVDGARDLERLAWAPEAGEGGA